MANLPSLLKKLEALHRQHVELEHEIAEVEQQIVDASNEPRPRKVRSTNNEMVEVVRDAVRVLREAGEPLPRKEIASRLGVSPWAAAYRLQKAIAMKFVERIGSGRYRCVDTVPEL